MTEREDSDLIAFAERVLALLDRGEFTATYKYAVLLGLTDLCFEHAGRHGDPPTSVSTGQLAEKVAAMYWSHARTFTNGSVLLQNKGNQASILKAILAFKAALPDPSVSVARARELSPARWNALLRSVEWTLVEMPLPRLQVLGASEERFIYQIGWRRDELRRAQFNAADFDNSIRFVGRSAQHLVRLSGVLRPVLQREWTALVACVNRLPESQLELFLFGARRLPTGKLLSDLRELQSNHCFYCRHVMPGEADVDHFIPWSRHPEESLENFVVAHRGCNRQKSDHLAAVAHLKRWVGRGVVDGVALRDMASRRDWEHGGGRAEAVARGLYFNLAAGIPLWVVGDQFERFDPASLRLD